MDAVLAAPADASELAEDLKLLDAPVMASAEIQHWQGYGDLVYGDGTDSFETDWP